MKTRHFSFSARQLEIIVLYILLLWYVSQEQRERVIEVVESGAVMTTSLDMFTRSNVDDDGNLHWKDIQKQQNIAKMYIYIYIC